MRISSPGIEGCGRRLNARCGCHGIECSGMKKTTIQVVHVYVQVVSQKVQGYAHDVRVVHVCIFQKKIKI